MKFDVTERLLEINRRFYEDFGESFSATRHRLQPGVRRILDSLTGDESVLDLGCGNGELARELARRKHRGAYLGLDFSPVLLREASVRPDEFPAEFRQLDLIRISAAHAELARSSGWDVITAFAVMHHIPSQDLRAEILATVSKLLQPSGRFIASNWQFLNSDKLRARIQPWSRGGLSEQDIDEGDYLLDWRDGGEGLRYVHQFSAEEMTKLAAQAALRENESFLSDGDGGRLSLYQIFNLSSAN